VFPIHYSVWFYLFFSKHPSVSLPVTIAVKQVIW